MEESLIGIAGLNRDPYLSDKNIGRVRHLYISKAFRRNGYARLLMISCLIASPISIYFLSNWIQNYEYRISIGPGVFILSAGLALLIALATVSFQTLSAARKNPVISLKVQ